MADHYCSRQDRFQNKPHGETPMSDRLVKLTSFGTVEEAHLAKNALEAEGIQAFLDGEATAGNLWHIGGAIGGIKLLVPEDEIPRAQRVLGGDDDDEEEEPDTRLTVKPPEGARPEPETRITNVRPEPGNEADDDLRDECDDDEDWEPDPGEAMASRAFKAAFLALFLPPLAFYSIWVLLGLWSWDGKLSDASQRKVTWAVVFNAVVLLILLLIMRSI
jgi:hypothetical protein